VIEAAVARVVAIAVYPLWLASASGAFYWWAVHEGLSVITLRTPAVTSTFPPVARPAFVTPEKECV
jgi:hypothetical protein